eukprot:Tbor_TRINITY_DN2760_c0_g1::TRINITY_DN2760_c0_g1_i1::g.15245::m.15245
MRSSRAICMSVTPVCRSNGVTFLTGGQLTDNDMNANVYSTNDRGIKSSSMFKEPNTAIYESYLPWTYFQPMKIDIEKMPAPEAKYYQRHTKKPWDISTTELLEIQARKKYIHCLMYSVLFVMLYFVLPKEKNFAGTRGCDGFWIMLPKNQPEQF